MIYIGPSIWKEANEHTVTDEKLGVLPHGSDLRDSVFKSVD